MDRKFKRLLFLVVALFAVAVVYPAMDGGCIVANAGAAGPEDRGGGASEQATAGDVPPIVMVPHKSKAELRKKIEVDFEIHKPSDIKLHKNKTLKKASITAKNRSKDSRESKKRELNNYRNNEFYVLEAKKFLNKYSNMLGISNIENSIRIEGVLKATSFGTTLLDFSIYIDGFILENSSVGFTFTHDDMIAIARFSIPQITPDMYRVVKAAKDKVKMLDEIRGLAGKKFVEMGLAKGWIVKGGPEDAEKIISWNSNIKNRKRYEKPIVIEKSTFLVRKFELGVRSNYSSQKNRGVTWVVFADAVTGDIVEFYGHRGLSGDEG